MNSILYYSNFCEKSKNLLKLLSKSTIKDEIHFVCIDKRTKNDAGEIVILLNKGKTVPLPTGINRVPAMLLLFNGNRILFGNEIKVHLDAKIAGQAGVSTKYDEVVSDNFSFLSQTPDEMAAKGDGGTKQMYFYSGIEEGGSIETPPEDYIPNKIGDNDYQKFQEQRQREIPAIPKINKTY
jgi:hypothetical protein